jgi:hypothetical protein
MLRTEEIDMILNSMTPILYPSELSNASEFFGKYHMLMKYTMESPD